MAKQVSKIVWIGRVLSGLACLVFLFSASLKLIGGQQVAEGIAHLGIPESAVMPLAFVELACVTLYVIPFTAVLGAVLLAAYLGGAICAHMRVGDQFVVQIGLGVALWLGLWLREPRLRPLLPLRA